ncbi:hypothetical protein AX16_003949 [Volvariella volvacea WC 439]|nr:hypothetical protein AX16_003949 [Volvariella volvacea WC 439]
MPLQYALQPSIAHAVGGATVASSADCRSEIRHQHPTTQPFTLPLPLALPSEPLTTAKVESIRSVFIQLIQHFELTVNSKPFYDHALEQCCLAHLPALGLGPTYTTTPKFQTALTATISIFCAAYSHHTDPLARQHLALYILLAIYIDDYFQDDVEPLREFSVNLMVGRKQRHVILDAFVQCTKRVGECFGDVMASMVCKGTLDFVIGMVVEFDHRATEQMMHPQVEQYPRFVRSLAGAALSFAVFFWPKNIPPEVYIQIIPDLCDWLNYVKYVVLLALAMLAATSAHASSPPSDVFSFYKEELSGESTNYISILSHITNKSKIQVHKELAQECINIGERMKRVLSTGGEGKDYHREKYEEAYEILMERVVRGYMNYHLATGRRYRLDELELDRVD